jgi:putative DNA primase/helicase
VGRRQLLNTPGGIVDLRTGECRAAKPEDYQTRITAVAPDLDGKPAYWLAYLRRVTDGNEELQRFIQRMLGYMLTGEVAEQSLFFLYGTGQNGKSTLVDTASGILGDYHCGVMMDALTFSDHDRHPTEIAKLRGVRIATANETERGRRWAESKIKYLTSPGKVTGRFMRQDEFDFDPSHKLLISGNNKPGLRSVDEAIRQRIKLVPFTVTIPLAERDKFFPAKLKGEWAEWPAILGWMIRGCDAWRDGGLVPPATVTDATDKYLESEDKMKTWIEECCVVGPNEWDLQSTLFQ